jgi:photosystem II stability/assembly factor-like uncharacterized protein
MKSNKLLIALFLIQVLLFSCKKDNDKYSNNYNYEKISSNLNESVNCVFFIDDKTGFSATYLGKVLKTTDGGISWTCKNITDLPIYSIYFVNKNIGFAVGGKPSCSGTGCIPPGSIVFKTTDGGESWTMKTVPYSWSNLNSVFFINENIGIAIGLGLQIRTTDGGETWEEFEFEYKGLMQKIYFINEQIGFAAGLYGNIFKTQDQGKNWTKLNNSCTGHIYDFSFVNENTGFAGGQQKIIKTTDGGATWKLLSNSPSEVYYIHFADAINGIAIGKGHYTGGDFGTWTNAIYCTKDGGSTWNIEDNIPFGQIGSFYSNRSGYFIEPKSTFKVSID